MKFTEFEQETVTALEYCNGPVKNRAKNAIKHLKRAHKLLNIDKEMSVFRAITAEEEAASSLFFSLKNQRYENADRLWFKKHTYKLAVYPFVQSIGKFLMETSKNEDFPFEKFKLIHKPIKDRKAISVKLKIKGEDKFAEIIPPLNFNISKNGNEIVTFSEQFDEIAQKNSFKKVMKYLKHVANQRNEVLYANSSGLPKLKGDIEEYLSQQKKKVFVILTLLLMIDPWRVEQKSSFVNQALNSFLLILNRIKRSDISSNFG